jgi:hypothetical protein
MPSAFLLLYHFIFDSYYILQYLRWLLAVLSRLNPTKIVREFNMVWGYNLEPVRSVYEHPLDAWGVTARAQCQRSGGAGTDFCWKRLVPNNGALVGGIRDVEFWCFIVFFTDLWKGGAGIGLGVYDYGGPLSSFRLYFIFFVFRQWSVSPKDKNHNRTLYNFAQGPQGPMVIPFKQKKTHITLKNVWGVLVHV